MPKVRDSKLEHLHPLYRSKAIQLMELLNKENAPFRLFEGFRNPNRQNYLYSQGRTLPGRIITNAKPWFSTHQYGLSGDWVLFIDGKWSWDDKGRFANYWKTLHDIANTLDLEPLSWEKPHLQLKNIKINDLRSGIYPEGKDETWEDNLCYYIQNWNGNTNPPNCPKGFTDRLTLAYPNVILKMGSKGKDVEILQELLIKKSFKVNIVDGIFGKHTDEMVKEFQKVNSLKPDGIVGPKTFEMLVK